MDQKELIQLLEEAQNAPVSYVDLKRVAQRIKVDMDTRKITGYTEFGVIKDHLAENIIFEVKRYKGDTDLAEKHCALHWENGENGGVLPVTEIDLSEDGHILMRWELSDEFTQHVGKIVYALHFFSILDGGFTYHAATNAAAGTLGDTLNASAHSLKKITPSEIEVYIAKMNELSAEMDSKIKSLEPIAETALKAKEYMEQAAAYAKQAETVSGIHIASKEIAGVIKPGDFKVEEDGTVWMIKTVTGESLILEDSVAGGLKVNEILGRSVQETTSGKNFLKNTATSQTINGVTFTVNDDGTVVANGTATDTVTYDVNTVIFDFDALFESGNYILSGCPSGGGNSNYRLILEAYGGGENLWFEEVGNGQSFTITDNWLTMIIYIRIESGVTVSNLVFKPMLRLATIEDDTYEPYTGGIPSPNPEYPQPIVSAGQKLAEGKQLYNNATSTNRGMDANGVASDNPQRVLSDLIEVIASTEYALKFPADVMFIAYFMYDSDKNYLTRVVFENTSGFATFTIEQSGYIRLAFMDTADTVLPLDDMRETVFYKTGGVKAAYDVGISKKITGKNLLQNTATSQTVNGVTFTVNDDGSVTANGTPSDTAILNMGYITLDAGSRFILTDGLNCNVDTYYTQLYSDSITTTPNSFSGEFTAVDVRYRARIVVKTQVSNLVFKPMIREAFITDDTYEPYTEQTLTLNRVLRAIPVTDASLANYTDGNGQMWCADYIDADRGVLVENIYFEKITKYTSKYTNGKGIEIFRVNTQVGTTCLNNEYNPVMCNRLVNYRPDDQYLSNSNCVSSYKGDVLLTLKDVSTEADFYNAINSADYWIAYPLATPIETPLTDEEIIALHQLRTNKGVTHIFGSNDPDAPMIFKYSSSEIGGVTLENSNLHVVNDVLRGQLEAKDEELQSQIETLETKNSTLSDQVSSLETKNAELTEQLEAATIPYTIEIDDTAGTINFIDK